MSNDTWVVVKHDAETVTLRGQMKPAVMGVMVLRKDQIASAQSTMGRLRVETTGGARYRVARGMRGAQVALTAEAFGLPAPDGKARPTRPSPEVQEFAKRQAALAAEELAEKREQRRA